MAEEADFWVVEKRRSGNWAPLFIDMPFLYKEGAEQFTKQRRENYPKEVLRVARYVREEQP